MGCYADSADQIAKKITDPTTWPTELALTVPSLSRHKRGRYGQKP